MIVYSSEHQFDYHTKEKISLVPVACVSAGLWEPTA